MSLLVLETSRPVRVTLLDASGANVARWTLQVEEREGRGMRWTPEGQLHTLGSGAGHVRAWQHRGWRRELSLRWGAGLTSRRETWDGSAWGTPVALPTAQAHTEILGWRAGALQVEPFADGEFGAFEAQAWERGPSLQDTKGVVHPALELVLTARDLSTEIAFLGIEGGYGWTSYGCYGWGW